MGLPALYQLSDELILLLDQVDPKTGALPEAFGDVRDLVAAKAEAVAAFVLNQEAGAAMVHAAAIKLEARAEAIERRATRLREYLAFHMKRAGISRIDAADHTFSIKLFLERDARVEIFDSAQLPLAFWRTPPQPAPVPNKVLISQELKTGVDVPGTRLVKSDRLTIE